MGPVATTRAASILDLTAEVARRYYRGRRSRGRRVYGPGRLPCVQNGTPCTGGARGSASHIAAAARRGRRLNVIALKSLIEEPSRQSSNALNVAAVLAMRLFTFAHFRTCDWMAMRGLPSLRHQQSRQWAGWDWEWL